MEKGSNRIAIVLGSRGRPMRLEAFIRSLRDLADDPHSYKVYVYIDEDGSADNPQSNTEILAAPGASNKLVVYGIQGSLGTGGASDYGHWYLSDGNTTAATTIWVGRIATTVPLNFSITFPYGVALTANTALELTSTEGSGNIFINAVIYYRTEAT